MTPSTTVAKFCMPRAFGWNGAAAVVGTIGSIHRVPEPEHVLWALLGV
jgi:hypothetical protein